MSSVRHGSAVLLLACLASSSAARVQFAGPHEVRLTVRDRWLLGRQSSRNVPYTENNFWVFIDSIRDEPVDDRRALFMTLTSPVYPNLRAIIDTRLDGRGQRITTTPQWSSRIPRADSVRMARQNILAYRGHSFPVSRLWELVPPVDPTRVTQGERWVDTLTFVGEEQQYRQALSGVRVSSRVGDTTIEGRQLWIVVDTTEVRYEERTLQDEWVLDTTAFVERVATGRMTGRMLYDRDIGLFRYRVDSTVLTGTAVLRYPDGRSYETPARYERRRTWTQTDPGAHSPIAPSPLASESGDSAALLRNLSIRLRNAGFTPSAIIEEATMRPLIALMDDPATTFALGADRDALFQSLVSVLVQTPPAVNSDTTRWPCTPAACALLADQYRAARQPELKTLGLLAHFVMDPRRWTDSLPADTTKWSHLLGDARLLANGAVAVSRSPSKDPLPGPADDWRPWVEWMVGVGNEPVCVDGACMSRSRIMQTRKLYFGRAHATAFRFGEVRTGRDIVGELRQKLAAATTDSGKLVYEYLLFQIGQYRPTAASIARHLSESPILVELGAIEIPALFENAPPRADDSTTTAVMDRFISIALGLESPWRNLDTLRPTYDGDDLRLPKDKLLLLADDLPPALRVKWSARVPIVTQSQWRDRSARADAALIALRSVARVGPFVRLEVSTQNRETRPYMTEPSFYRARRTYYLMERDDEWVLVAFSHAYNE